MKIQTDRLTLHEISWNDLEKIHQLHLVPEVDEFNTLGIPENLDETRNNIQGYIDNQNETPRSRFCWKAILKETNDFIGIAGMTLSNDRFKMGEFYYKLFPKFWGNGFATEMAKALIKFGFEECKLHRIEAGVATQNLVSIRVLEKAGLTREGTRRKILPIRGEWVDNFHYAILEGDIL
ncbi:Protein N-acetyltransferase, RimJ/RimL family [Tangfeifania diversioriginum]|uniref:Protein N-acetyltransferase, RimJ/RimL family n=1 Tax=Tangfeifania diversioriginum TaxID=1168035 RepID=A0A1M6K6D1_9BACT|nr:GNAT family N-acetyltransferase [Tangfeifania diversioriginum]SHJ54485.1 Protein N-acetyltransferase, RimJ/RimL family [Tangfeifania diversioriginum]